MPGLDDHHQWPDHPGSRPASPTTRSSSGASAGTSTSGPKRPSRCSSVPGPENCATKSCTTSSNARIAVVRLATRPRHVPSVEHDLVQRDHAGLFAGKFDASRLRHAGPRRRVAPRNGEGVEVAGDSRPPVVAEARRVARRPCCDHGVVGGLPGRGRERQGKAAHVFDEITQAVLGARRRPVERVVGNPVEQGGHASGGRGQVDESGHARETTRARRNSSAGRRRAAVSGGAAGCPADPGSAWFERRVGVLQRLVGRIAVVVGLVTQAGRSSCAVFDARPVDSRCCVKPVGCCSPASSLSDASSVSRIWLSVFWSACWSSSGRAFRRECVVGRDVRVVGRWSHVVGRGRQHVVGRRLRHIVLRAARLRPTAAQRHRRRTRSPHQTEAPPHRLTAARRRHQSEAQRRRPTARRISSAGRRRTRPQARR